MYKKNLGYRLYAVFICLFSSTLFISACAPPRIYKIDIQQGNKLTKEDVQSIKLGMSQEEVQDILGTPTLNAIFRKDRWYYIYYNKPAYGKIQKNHLIIYFSNGVVSKICEDYL